MKKIPSQLSNKNTAFDDNDYVNGWLKRLKANLGDDEALKACIDKIYVEGFEDGINQ